MDKKQNLPFFIYHGKSDEVISYANAGKTYERFKASGFEKVSLYTEEYLSHSVSP